jgi:hypothetical protein
MGRMTTIGTDSISCPSCHPYNNPMDLLQLVRIRQRPLFATFFWGCSGTFHRTALSLAW